MGRVQQSQRAASDPSQHLAQVRAYFKQLQEQPQLMAHRAAQAGLGKELHLAAMRRPLAGSFGPLIQAGPRCLSLIFSRSGRPAAPLTLCVRVSCWGRGPCCSSMQKGEGGFLLAFPPHPNCLASPGCSALPPIHFLVHTRAHTHTHTHTYIHTHTHSHAHTCSSCLRGFKACTVGGQKPKQLRACSKWPPLLARMPYERAVQQQ